MVHHSLKAVIGVALVEASSGWGKLANLDCVVSTPRLLPNAGPVPRVGPTYRTYADGISPRALY